MPIESLSSLQPANLESIVMVILIVVAGLSLGSMANRAVKLAPNRTKLEGLAAHFRRLRAKYFGPRMGQ